MITQKWNKQQRSQHRPFLASKGVSGLISSFVCMFVLFARDQCSGIGRVFTSDFSGRLASDNRKSRENSYFSDSLKVKRVGKLQCNSH